MSIWLVALIGGFLGTGHCLGMCGGFVALVSAQDRGLFRPLIYHLGRISAYAILGGFMGLLGQRLSTWQPGLMPMWMLLTGGVMILLALNLVFGTFRGIGAQGASCQAASLFRECLTSRDRSVLWLAGFCNGLIPCGLVYAFLATAAPLGNPGLSAGLMAVFGLGTVPGLLLASLGFGTIPVRWRSMLHQLAAGCIVFQGLYFVSCGIAYWSTPALACPYCKMAP